MWLLPLLWLLAISCLTQCTAAPISYLRSISPNHHAHTTPTTTPIRGWSSWNIYNTTVDEQGILQTAQQMIDRNLLSAGYNYILIDDGWTACAQYDKRDATKCTQPYQRTAVHSWKLVADPQRFPRGMRALVDDLHAMGFYVGIYTASSALTCAGFTATYGYEQLDVQTFITDWDLDFIKLDTCNSDCTYVDGCIQQMTNLMLKQMYEEHSLRTAKPNRLLPILYLDSGNPTSPARLYNPERLFWPGGKQTALLASQSPAAQEVTRKVFNARINEGTGTLDTLPVWQWLPQAVSLVRVQRLYDGPILPIIYKSWFDIFDTFESTVDNAYHTGLHSYSQPYHTCNTQHTADMLTIGLGGQTFEQYRLQYYMWLILGSPLLLSTTITDLSFVELNLLNDADLLMIAEDSSCVMGSLVRSMGGCDVWIRPLSDVRYGGFAVLVINTGDTKCSTSVRLHSPIEWWSDFYPICLHEVTVFDLTKKHIWEQPVQRCINVTVAPQDSVFLYVEPTYDSHENPVGACNFEASTDNPIATAIR